MKKTIHFIFVFTISLYLVSCCEQPADTHELEETAHKEKTEKVETHEHASATTLALNSGKQWLANLETTTGIKNMQKLMNSFTDKESVEAYADLKTKLDAEFNTIIKECTMTGEPHNQLHNYLLPMGEIFDGIGSSDLDTCKASFDKLNKHLAEYSSYFE